MVGAALSTRCSTPFNRNVITLLIVSILSGISLICPEEDLLMGLYRRDFTWTGDAPGED